MFMANFYRIKNYKKSNENEWDLPKGWVFWHDESSSLQPAQRFFLTPQSGGSGTKNTTRNARESSDNRNEMALWEKYYGSSIMPRKTKVAIPDSGWRLVERIDGIRYRRKGKHEGLYEHEFSRKVPVYEAEGGRAFYLDLGSDFVADERGFVVP